MADLSAFPDGQLFHVSKTMGGRLGLFTETGSAVTARKTVGRLGRQPDPPLLPSCVIIRAERR
jgi:hypothetical protein